MVGSVKVVCLRMKPPAAMRRADAGIGCVALMLDILVEPYNGQQWRPIKVTIYKLRLYRWPDISHKKILFGLLKSF